MRRQFASLMLGLGFLAGCAAQQKPKDYTKFLAAQPKSILIIPVVNESTNVDAADYFLSTLPVPVAERGYYVFPVNLVKRVLEDEGLADASLVHNADTSRLAAMFGADAVMYATIKNWTAKYLVLSTSVQVEFEYVLKDGKTGETLWTARRSMVYQPQNNNAGGNPLAALVGALIQAAVTKAVPNYMPLARQANAMAMAYPGEGFPAGPYRGEYGKDH
jgi:hypothetical protein